MSTKHFLFIWLLLLYYTGTAQTASVYRGGTLFGTYSTIAAASAAANMIGDSIVLSAHTFKEHDLNLYGGQIWKGTITATDTTIIDAEKKGRIATFNYKGKKNLVFRDIILTNGDNVDASAAILGGNSTGDTLKLMGRSVVRNCHATRTCGVANHIHLFGHAKIVNNSAGSHAGVAVRVDAYDSTEINYNSAPIGGVAAEDTILHSSASGGGAVYAYSAGVKILNNKADIAGGVVVGGLRLYGAQALGNEAPIGALAFVRVSAELRDAYVYNPGMGPVRQNEIFINDGRTLVLNGAWFGDSDTTGLIIRRGPTSTITMGKYAIANWRVNRANPVTKADTVFPVQAAFTYMDGTAVPANSYWWLQGNFTTDKGSFSDPKPKMSPTDTIGSMYRSYIYGPGDTGSKPVSFVCNVDRDTFRVTVPVWGKPPTGIAQVFREEQVLVYPNPAKDILTVQGVQAGSMLRLYDVSGKLLMQQECASALQQLNIAHLPKGAYMLSITTPGGNEGTAKVMKE